MSLTDWLNQGLLAKHKPQRREIMELLRIVERDLAQCRLMGLDRDWQLGIAYNAALQLATAALLACGYRTKGEAHHYRVIQSLAYTIDLEPELIDQLDGFRKIRNVSDYERAGAVSDQQAQEMFALTLRLQITVTDWLKNNHPELI